MAREDLIAPLNTILQTQSLTQWAAQHPQRQQRDGRAPTWVVPLNHDVTMVVRHAWHGGALASLTRDLWRAPGRAPHEAMVSDRLRAGGVRTPELLAWTTDAAGPGMVRIDVCTTFVPDAHDLPSWFATAREEQLPVAIAAVASLVEQLAVLGARHADLNLKNILLTSQQIAHVLDVDRVTFSRAPVDRIRVANWDRLLRSATKWARTAGARIPLDALRNAAQRATAQSSKTPRTA
jgi:hypothetical protein